jgi:hypothetical protein
MTGVPSHVLLSPHEADTSVTGRFLLGTDSKLRTPLALARAHIPELSVSPTKLACDDGALSFLADWDVFP